MSSWSFAGVGVGWSTTSSLALVQVTAFMTPSVAGETQRADSKRPRDRRIHEKELSALAVRVRVKEGKTMSEQTTTPRLTDQFAKAMVYAERKHHTQVRKGGDIPYVGHLLSVASLVINDDGSEAQAIAALLHDAVEDAGGPATLQEIRAEFGDDGGADRRGVQRHRQDTEAAVARTQAGLHQSPWHRW